MMHDGRGDDALGGGGGEGYGGREGCGGEDDKDMSSMHTTMLGDRGRGDQRRCPN